MSCTFNLEEYKKEYKIQTIDKVICVLMGLLIVYSSFNYMGVN